MQYALPILSLLPMAAFAQPSRNNHSLKRRLLLQFGQPRDLT